jgi:C_GCAxxG_C_C family probable redox protein
VRRYASDPRRKLARADRLVGPLLLCRQHNLPFDALAHAVAAALLYTSPNDDGATEIRTAIKTNGLQAAIESYCGLTPADEEIINAICRAYWDLQAEKARGLGFHYEQTYHGCGQCAFAAVTETLGNFDEAVFEAATGLAGGLGLAGDSTCGALLGATLAFGLVSPRRREHFDGDKESKYRAFRMAQKLRQKYLDTYGSIRCHDIHREILGRPFDLRDSAERKAFEAAGAHDDKCTNVVAQAAQWAVEIIGEEEWKHDTPRI